MNKENEMVLRDQFNELSDKQKRSLRDEFYVRSGFSQAAFYYKLNNNKFMPLERELMVSLLAKYAKQ